MIFAWFACLAMMVQMPLAASSSLFLSLCLCLKLLLVCIRINKLELWKFFNEKPHTSPIVMTMTIAAAATAITTTKCVCVFVMRWSIITTAHLWLLWLTINIVNSEGCTHAHKITWIQCINCESVQLCAPNITCTNAKFTFECSDPLTNVSRKHNQNTSKQSQKEEEKKTPALLPYIFLIIIICGFIRNAFRQTLLAS